MNPFTTRMNRSQFAVSIAMLPAMLLLGVSFLITGNYFTVIGFVFFLYMLSFPARRLNDIGMSPAIWLIPFFLMLPLSITSYILMFYLPALYIFLLVVKGDPLPNKNGPVPSGFWFNSILLGNPLKIVKPDTVTNPEQSRNNESKETSQKRNNFKTTVKDLVQKVTSMIKKGK